MRGHRLLVAAAVALILAGCASGSRSGESLSRSSDIEGFRAHDSNSGGMDAIVAGIVEVDLDAGCIWLSDPDGARYPVVWPVGTATQSDPLRIVLADGQLVQAETKSRAAADTSTPTRRRAAWAWSRFLVHVFR
jgi:hypothetical protein